MLFVSHQSKNASSNAYNQRIFNNEKHCNQLGAQTSILFLGDQFFRSPVLIQPLNVPFILRSIRQFDVIIAEANGPAAVLAFSKYLLRHNTIVIYDVHNDAFSEARLVRKGQFDLKGYFVDFQIRLLEYIAFNFTDYFSVASPGLKHRLLSRNRFIKEDSIEVVLNGVDLKSFKPQSGSKNSGCGNYFTVTYAGSYVKYQGIENLVKAAEILHNENIHFKFLSLREEDSALKKEIKSRLGDKVTLIDWLPKDELISELSSSDVLLIPSMKDCDRAIFPSKFAEFLAIAKPVIVTRIDETARIVEQFDCGFVCEPTAESIAETILRAQMIPEEKLRLKGHNGRQFAEKELDINVICRRYLQFMARLLKMK
jgi:glycosyltransferase involved in cell wall biosynthesis